MRLRSIVLSVVLGLVAVAGVGARQTSPAQLALQAAQDVEIINRDLNGAIVRYRAVVSAYPNDRTVVPVALFRLAGCLEQLGKPEALAAYERVVKEYPGTTPAKDAQKKVAALGKEGSGFSITEIDGDNSGAPSLDGGYMSFTDWETGDVAVRDLRSGKTRRVTGNAPSTLNSPEAWDSVPSPDGRQIAYTWGNGNEPGDLRVISSQGGSARIVCCGNVSAEIGPFSDIEPFGWSTDSKRILFALIGGNRAGRTTALATVPAGGGAPRVLKTIEGTVGRASWSPDGQFIIYDAARDAGTTDHAVFIMRADGSNAIVLLPGDSNDEVLDWFPDGHRILFVSDILGTTSAFTQAVVDGKAIGKPSLVKEALVVEASGTFADTIQGQGFTRDGSYHYRTQGVFEDIATFHLDASGGVSRGLERLTSRFANGRQGASWSPDGSRIAYVQAPFGPAARPSLSIHSVADGQVRTVAVDLAAIANPSWTPDGRAIIAEGTTTDRRQGIFRINLDTEALSPIGEMTPARARTFARRRFPKVTRDGQEVLYLLDQKIIQALNLTSGAVRVVFEGPVMMDFALSPDGRSIAVSLNPWEQIPKGPPVEIVPVTGGVARSLAPELRDGFPNEGIAWTADGRWVWFICYYKNPGVPLWRVSVDGGPAERMSAVSKSMPGIRRLSAAPDGSMAASTQVWKNQQFVMRNIPPAAGTQKR